ncbi:MAG: hypothetical protein M0036_03785 [Desulfobacteraceae bacterium]|nr:hypothetical protein [Desulfobacteraceae bacterium]
MSQHPLTWAIGLVMAAAGASYLKALWLLLTHLNAAQNGAGHQQALTKAALLGRWTMGLQAAAFILVLAGVTNLWVSVVPGAMCGSGVLQAMGAAGRQFLILMAATLVLFYCWRAVEVLDRGHTKALPADLQSRWLLLIAPFMILAFWRGIEALRAAGRQGPVSCCALLYDQLRDTGRLGTIFNFSISGHTWLLLSLSLTLFMAGRGLRWWRRPALAGKGVIIACGAGLVLWWVALYQGLTLEVAPYIYQTRFHPCPWCLFLADHKAVGLIYFGLPAWATLECVAALTVWGVSRRYPQAAEPARRRLRQAGWRIALSALLFGLSAAWPILFG